MYAGSTTYAIWSLDVCLLICLLGCLSTYVSLSVNLSVYLFVLSVCLPIVCSSMYVYLVCQFVSVYGPSSTCML